MRNNKIIKILILILAVVVLNVSLPEETFADSRIALGEGSQPRIKIRAIENKRKQAKEKINELKRKENLEIGKLQKSQERLEETKNDIEFYEAKLDNARAKLARLETQLWKAQAEQREVGRLAGERLKQIYKGERITILHLIFAAQDLNTFLDRVYYQKRLATADKKMLQDLRAKTKQIEAVKYSVASEQNNINHTIALMNMKKQQIAESINVSKVLINKLRTDRATYEQAERELEQQSRRLAAMLERAYRKSSGSIKVTTGFMRPVSGIITSPFGWRRHPIFKSRSFHTGVDIGAPNRTPIRAANSGKVVFAGWYGGYGKVVIVNHGSYQGRPTSTLYAHLSSIAVGVGTNLQKGQVVGYEGTTGYSTGPHLHFEVRLDGNPTNPMSYIP